MALPRPFSSWKPILSQVTCGCVCNKLLSWLLEGLAWPSFKYPWRLGASFPFPPGEARNSLGLRGPKGEAPAPELRSSAPGPSTALSPVCPSSARTEKPRSQALLGNLPRASVTLCCSRGRQTEGASKAGRSSPRQLPLAQQDEL